MKHTPEPWLVGDHKGDERRSVYPADGRGWAVACCLVDTHAARDQTEAQANAHRIVACVNALAGINPEAVPDLLAVCRHVVEVLGKEDMPWWIDSPDRGGFDADAIRAAIAKATT